MDNSENRAKTSQKLTFVKFPIKKMKKEELEILISSLTSYLICSTLKKRRKKAKKLLKIFVNELQRIEAVDNSSH